MNSVAAFDATLQAISTLLVFVAAYLGLVVLTIICLVAGELISHHAGIVREYGEKPFLLATRSLPELNLETGRSCGSLPPHIFQGERGVS